MAAIRLPAQTYAEAVPIMRAPYTPSVVRSRILAVPKEANSPCTVVLYATSETVMDRFNISCGDAWGVKFKTLAHRTTPEERSHYMKIRATVTAFGRSFEDFGESSDEGEAMCEYNARAQAFKRAARWVGVGQCLYQVDAIRLFRGSGNQELPIARNGKPYIDERAEAYILSRYSEWLRRKGIAVYGQAFDHLEAVGGSLTVLEGQRPELTGDHAPIANGRTDSARATVSAESAPTGQVVLNSVPAASRRHASAGSKGVAAIRDAARAVGYRDAVVESLIALARGEDQGGLSQAQAECVQEWIAVLARIEIPGETVLESATFALENCATREGAQVKFTQWVAGKASAAPAGAPPQSDLKTSSGGGGSEQPSAAPSESQEGERPDSDTGSDTESALRELHQAVDRNEYTERAAARIAALAVGADPDGRVDWSTIAPETIRYVGELLDAAATLEWSPRQLDDEITRAHNSTQQGTSASRFGAFAVHLINTAEARGEEAIRATLAAEASA